MTREHPGEINDQLPDAADAHARPARTLAGRATAGARSGFKRYTREVMEAVRAARRATEDAPDCEHARQWAARAGSHELGAMWIGHATMLLHIGGKTVLTDPVFSERIGMTVNLEGLVPAGGITFGLSRLARPALSVGSLPPIDLVLLSHAHFDHLDRPSLAKLARGAARGATVVTARNTSRLVPRTGFGRIVEVDWNNTVRAAGLTIDAVKPAHWGARTAIDHFRKWNAYVVQSDRAGEGKKRAFFAGDTALTDSFDRVGPVDLAIFGIGAYDPWHDAHATPEQAWAMFRGMGARRLAPMHHSTFRLSEEPLGEPMQRLRRAAGPDADRIICPEIGSCWSRPGGAIAR